MRQYPGPLVASRGAPSRGSYILASIYESTPRAAANGVNARNCSRGSIVAKYELDDVNRRG